MSLFAGSFDRIIDVPCNDEKLIYDLKVSCLNWRGHVEQQDSGERLSHSILDQGIKQLPAADLER
jgi:hypothetical protein